MKKSFFEPFQQQWKDAQALPMAQRIEEEEKLIEKLAERSECRGLDNNALQLICQHGNPSGFAYAHGFTVHWFPSRGVAKHAYFRDQKVIQDNDGRGREALGPVPKATTLLDALHWGRGFCQAWF